MYMPLPGAKIGLPIAQKGNEPSSNHRFSRLNLLFHRLKKRGFRQPSALGRSFHDVQAAWRIADSPLVVEFGMLLLLKQNNIWKID